MSENSVLPGCSKVSNTHLQYSLKFCEIQCLEFRYFMIIRFNVIVSKCSDWFRQIYLRPRVWKYDFPHFPTAVSTVKLSFVTWGWLFSCIIESDSHSNNNFVMLLQRCSRIIDNEVHAFYVLRLLYTFINRPLKNSWNQIEVLHWKLIPMFAISYPPQLTTNVLTIYCV